MSYECDRQYCSAIALCWSTVCDRGKAREERLCFLVERYDRIICSYSDPCSICGAAQLEKVRARAKEREID